MFKNRIPLFSLFGFKVNLDLTWLILALLITWSLAKGFFPQFFEGHSEATYWIMGAFGALGLFVSIVFHEFCHSMVAKRFGIPIEGITLFIFGGIAEMHDEPPSPKSEFLMAGAGPLSSFVLAGIFYLVFLSGKSMQWALPITDVIVYLSWINVILAFFNLVPAFPLDGGRLLRSVLWGIKKDLQWATRHAARAGGAFGAFLIILGIVSALGGNFIGGIWYVLIGMFIRKASQVSYEQVLIRKSLTGESIERFMKSDPVTVNSSLSVRELVEDYFYKYHYRFIPVEKDGQLSGYISPDVVKKVPKDQWDDHKIEDFTVPCSDENTISADTDATEAFSLMRSSGNNRLMVVRDNTLLGIITLKDIQNFISTKLELESDDKISTFSANR